MLNYAVCEISGKQYLVTAGRSIEVDFLGDDKKEVEAKVLVISDDNKLKIGNPYLSEKLKLNVVSKKQKEKVRVSKFHAKANFRKTTGQRKRVSIVTL